MVSVSVHQPNFMPWLKLLTKIMASDVFVAYDSVQFTRKEFHARQKVMTRRGAAEWLTVPVVSTGSRQVLKDTRIARSFDWRADHLRFLQTHYGAAPFFDEVFPLIEGVYDLGHDLLVDHNLDLLDTFCTYLAADVRIVRASEIPHTGEREDRLLDLVRGAGGDMHLTSTSTTHHIDWTGFDAAGIPVLEQAFEHPVYPQQQSGEFVPHLAAADLLFALGRGAGPVLDSSSAFTPLAAQSTLIE